MLVNERIVVPNKLLPNACLMIHIWYSNPEPQLQKGSIAERFLKNDAILIIELHPPHKGTASHHNA